MLGNIEFDIEKLFFCNYDCYSPYSFLNFGRLVCMRKYLGFRNCTQGTVMEEIDLLPRYGSNALEPGSHPALAVFL